MYVHYVKLLHKVLGMKVGIGVKGKRKELVLNVKARLETGPKVERRSTVNLLAFCICRPRDIREKDPWVDSNVVCRCPP